MKPSILLKNVFLVRFIIITIIIIKFLINLGKSCTFLAFLFGLVLYSCLMSAGIGSSSPATLSGIDNECMNDIASLYT